MIKVSSVKKSGISPEKIPADTKKGRHTYRGRPSFSSLFN